MTPPPGGDGGDDDGDDDDALLFFSGTACLLLDRHLLHDTLHHRILALVVRVVLRTVAAARQLSASHPMQTCENSAATHVHVPTDRVTQLSIRNDKLVGQHRFHERRRTAHPLVAPAPAAAVATW